MVQSKGPLRLSLSKPARYVLRLTLQHVRLKQTVQMHHHVFHFGIVDRASRGAAPGFFGAGIIGEYADEIDRVEVFEVDRLRIDDPAAENKVQFLI